MEKGFNSDVIVSGVNYHVQTEDWGWDKAFVVSRVYCQGAVLKSIKTHYSTILFAGPISDQQAIRLAVRDQHHKILDQLVSGHLFIS